MSPVAEKVVVFEVVICEVTRPVVKPEFVARSTSNPVSLFEVSVQVKLICVLLITDVVNPLGVVGTTTGITCVLETTGAEDIDSAPIPTAITRK